MDGKWLPIAFAVTSDERLDIAPTGYRVNYCGNGITVGVSSSA